MDSCKTLCRTKRQLIGGGRSSERGGKFMDRAHHHGSLRNKKSLNQYPEVYIDKDADFASIKIAPGVESRSYLKDGFVVCEDQKGHILEIQLLNLRTLLATKKQMAA
jgi:hypothetical protein